MEGGAEVSEPIFAAFEKLQRERDEAREKLKAVLATLNQTEL
jgi:hypothetical protein